MESRKKFREWNPAEYAEWPVTPAEVLPEDDLMFFLLETIPRMDLSSLHVNYEQEPRGATPFDVAMMCTLSVYPYFVGVYSSRKIAAACERNLAFMAIVAAEAPDFRTISDFRKIHLDTFHDLFVEVLRLAGQAGMVKLGNVALDGSKFKANASRHKAMSYGYMEKELARLRAEIRELTERQGFDPNIAVGRQKHHQSLPETVECPPPGVRRCRKPWLTNCGLLRGARAMPNESTSWNPCSVKSNRAAASASFSCAVRPKSAEIGVWSA